jgi:hypothetical protein
MESSARGEVLPLVVGSEIVGAGVFPIMEAPIKPIIPASRPLITPAMIAFFTAGEALLADCSENVTGGAYTNVGVGTGATTVGSSAGTAGRTTVSALLVSEVVKFES